MDNNTYYLEQDACWDLPCGQEDYAYADDEKKFSIKGLFGGNKDGGGSNWDADKTQDLIGTGLGLWQTIVANRGNKDGGVGQQPPVIITQEKSNTGLIVGVGAVAVIGIGLAIYFGMKNK